MRKKRKLFRLILKYFREGERLYAAGMLVIITLLSIGVVTINVLANLWNKRFYHALQIYDKPQLIQLTIYYLAILFGFTFTFVFRDYLQKRLALRWRFWLNQEIMGRWLAGKRYYYLEALGHYADNPDQRIADDIHQLTQGTLDIVFQLFSAVITILSIAGILWNISGPMTLFGVTIHGYLFWVSFIYSIGGSAITHWIGKPLVALNFEREKRQADFRFELMKVRQGAENICIYASEQSHFDILTAKIKFALENYYHLIAKERDLGLFTKAFIFSDQVVPFVVTLPIYLAKKIDLGGMMQTVNAFMQITYSFSIIVTIYPALASWAATGRRLTTFIDALDRVDECYQAQSLTLEEHAASTVDVVGCEVFLPNNRPLLKDINLHFERGKYYLLIGPSGLGKSVFIKALSGVWPYAKGVVSKPAGERFFYVPQEPFIITGTLLDNIRYPSQKPLSTEQGRSLLQQCALSHLRDELESEKNWDDILSLGEKQRLTIARILHFKPDWVILDETTVSVDNQLERILYECLQKSLPHCTYISIGHRDSLDAYHDEIIDMAQFV